MEESFTAGQVTRITGVAYDTLDFWTKTGLIAPGIAPLQGRAGWRRYAFRDLVSIKVAMQLRQAGIPLQGIRRVLSYLRETLAVDEPLAECRLVASGRDVFLVRGADELVSLLQAPGQGAYTWLISLDRLATEVREEVTRLRAAG